MSNYLPLTVLIGCEQSGVVRDAFLKMGFDAWSCDLLASEDGSNRHIVGDVRDVVDSVKPDLLYVAHPPCTRLCASGVRWLNEPPKNPPADATPQEAEDWPKLSREAKLEIMWKHLRDGAELFADCLHANVPHRAIENPVMHGHAKEAIRDYFEFSQSVQPWHFGTEPGGEDDQKKRTCLWNVNLPDLQPLGILDGSTAGNAIHFASPGKDRWKERSKFFPGMARAMAETWGPYAYQQKTGMEYAA